MAYVVTDICVDCKYTDCAAVCPVQAFHEAPDRLHINPTTCIDCDACVPECPIEAIFAESNVPPKYAKDIAINKDECEKFPLIVEKIKALRGPKCSNPNAGE